MVSSPTLRKAPETSKRLSFGGALDAVRFKLAPLVLAALASCAPAAVDDVQGTARGDIYSVYSMPGEDTLDGSNYPDSPESTGDGVDTASNPGMDLETLREVLEVTGPFATTDGYSIGLKAPGVKATLYVIGHDANGGTAEIGVEMSGSSTTTYVVVPSQTVSVDIASDQEAIYQGISTSPVQ